MDNKTIELHTIATFQGKEYELENLLNGLLNKLEEKDKEIESLKIDNKRLQHNEKVFKSRNEKAIEVLKNTMYPYIAKAKALNILQGDDKDGKD